MTTTVASPETRTRADEAGQPADVFVAFGITGDLAKVMTFMSLYRLERRGLIDGPIVGVAVDDWTIDDLKERARTSIEGAPPPVRAYAPGSWDPAAAGHGRWHDPWIAS